MTVGLSLLDEPIGLLCLLAGMLVKKPDRMLKWLSSFCGYPNTPVYVTELFPVSEHTAVVKAHLKVLHNP